MSDDRRGAPVVPKRGSLVIAGKENRGPVSSGRTETERGAVRCSVCVYPKRESKSAQQLEGEEVDTRTRVIAAVWCCCEVLQEEHKTWEKEKEKEEEERKQRTWRSPSWQQRGGVSLARTTTVKKNNNNDRRIGDAVWRF